MIYLAVWVLESTVGERTLNRQNSSKRKHVLKSVKQTPVDQQLAHNDIYRKLSQQSSNRRQRAVSSYSSLKFPQTIKKKQWQLDFQRFLKLGVIHGSWGWQRRPWGATGQAAGWKGTWAGRGGRVPSFATPMRPSFVARSRALSSPASLRNLQPSRGGSKPLAPFYLQPKAN